MKTIAKLNQNQKDKIESIWNKLYLFLNELYDRWQDEKDYEDWADYDEEIRKRLINATNETDESLNIVDVKIAKRPFGVSFVIYNDYRVIISVTNAKYTYNIQQK